MEQLGGRGVRVLGKEKLRQDHVRNDKYFGVYSECDRKPLEKYFSSLGKYMICFDKSTIAIKWTIDYVLSRMEIIS